jgi:hypothetical protein
MKNEYNVILGNSTWFLGGGKKIRFWTNAWYGQPLVNFITSPNLLINEDATVADFILDSHWNLPQDFHSFCPHELPCAISNTPTSSQK